MNCNENTIGQRINTVLAKKNIKQKDLASALGVTDNTISYYVSGKRIPNTERIIKISKFLNVSSDYLLGLADEPSNDPEINDIKAYTGLTENSIEFLHSLFCDLKEYNSYISNGGEAKNELTARYEYSGYLLHFLNDAFACEEIKEVSKYAKKYIDAVCDCTRFGTEEPDLAKFMYQNMCIALLDKISFSAVPTREKHLKKRRRIMTNYDRIKAMNVEETADLLDSFRQCSNCRRNGNNCFPTFRTEEWLEQEVLG